MSATATTTMIGLSGPYVRPILTDALGGIILGNCDSIDLDHGPQAPYLYATLISGSDVAQDFLAYASPIKMALVALETVADDAATSLDWPFGHDALVKGVESTILGAREYLSEAPVDALPVFVEAVTAGEAFLASLRDEPSGASPEGSEDDEVEPESVASSSGSVPLPLEDIAAIARVLQGYLLGMGFGEAEDLEEFLGIGAQPSPAAFEELGEQLAVIARVLKALEKPKARGRQVATEEAARMDETGAADTWDEQQGKILAASRLEWLRLAQGVVTRCANERAQATTTTEGGE
jgi:hypothetical protein